MKRTYTQQTAGIALFLLSMVIGGYVSCGLAQTPQLPAPASALPLPAAVQTLHLASFQQAEPKDASKQPARSLTLRSVTLLSPDGKTAVGIWNIPDGGGHMAVYDMATGKTRFHVDSNGGMGGNYIEGTAFAPDSKSFVTGWESNSVRIWDAATGHIIAGFALKQRWGRPLAISPEGKTLVTGNYSGMVQLWNLATGQVLRSLRGHTASLWGASFSPDGKTLATCGEDRTARLWNVATGQLRFTLKGHQDTVYSLAFSHDGNTLATGSADRQIKLWETQSGRDLRTLTGHKGVVFSLAFSTNNTWLASGGLDETARLWKVSTGHLEQTFEAGYGGVPVIAFWNSDTQLAVANDNTLTLWPLTLSKLP